MPVTITTKGLDAVIQDLTKVTERVIQKITLDVVANLKEANPVLTGWSRSNWIPRVGAPFSGTIGSPEAVSQAPSTIGSYTLGQGSVFITNNVPYIVRLANGYSAKAPAGWVERSIDKAVRVDLGKVL